MTILCVDDQLLNLQIRKQMLELKGYQVLIATDRQSAVNAAADARIDLAIIDYHLADRENGEQVARDLRAMLPQLPLIMLSGDPNLPQSAQDFVDSVFIKGSSQVGDLLNTIRRLLDRPA